MHINRPLQWGYCSYHHTLEGHSGWIKSVFVTPNGKYVISISDDSTLKVWDRKTGKEIKTLTEHSDLVSPVFVTPDGEYAVSASSDNMFKMQGLKTGKVWNLNTRKEVETLTGRQDKINADSVTSNGNYNVSISDDRMLKVWDLKTGKEISAFCGESPFLSCALSPDGTMIVAGEDGGRVHFLQFER